MTFQALRLYDYRTEVHFAATNWRCHHSSVSGVTIETNLPACLLAYGQNGEVDPTGARLSAAAPRWGYERNISFGAGKVLEVERGIPPNQKVRDQVAAQLSEYAKLSVEFTNAIEKIVTPYPPASPAGASEVDTGVMRPLGDQLAFSKITVDEAAKKLVDGAKRAIRQS